MRLPLFAAFIGVAQLLTAALVPIVQAQSTAPVPTIRTTTRIVPVEVVVTGAQGVQVKGLPRSAFTIMEDGKQQRILQFEEHNAKPYAAKPLPPSRPGVFSNIIEADPESAPVILLIDRVNWDPRSLPDVTRELTDSVRVLPQGTRIAIFALSARLQMLLNFTTDRNLVLSYIKSHAADLGVPSPTDATSIEYQVPHDMSADSFSQTANLTSLVQQSLTKSNDVSTLEQLNELAAYLGGVPGRKNVIWVTKSFSMYIPSSNAGPSDSTLLDYECRRTFGLLAAAHVAMYPVDPRGLPVVEPFNPVGPSFFKGYFTDTAAEDTMTQFATATGAIPCLHRNLWASCVTKAVEHGSHVYILAYDPGHDNDGTYHSIKVTLNIPGYQLDYRRGYGDTMPHRISHETKTMQRVDSLGLFQPAMQFATLPAAFVQYREEITPFNETSLHLAKGNTIVEGVNGPFRDYQITYQVLPKTLGMDSTNADRHQADVIFGALIYDRNGKLLTGITEELSANASDADYARIRREGLLYRQVISVPANGAFIRTGVLEKTTGNIGSLQVPIARVPLPGATGTP